MARVRGLMGCVVLVRLLSGCSSSSTQPPPAGAGSAGGNGSGGSASSANTGASSAGSAGTSAGGDCPEGTASLCGMLAAHNAVRAAAPAADPPLPPLAWDADLAAHAQAWADTCPSGHNPDRTVDGQTAGENIFWTSSGSPVAPVAAVDVWASEGTGYDDTNNECNGAPYTTANFNCGHYTQLVWRSTTRVGCGMRTGCTGSFAQPWVCDYLPAGNLVGNDGAFARAY